jgi:hypothetical protein
MAKGLFVMLFATTAGLTMSGIIANLYRLLARKPQGTPAHAVHIAVMVIAGPSVLIENSTTSLRARDCSKLAYGFAIFIAAYWSFALGLFAMRIGEALY